MNKLKVSEVDEADMLRVCSVQTEKQRNNKNQERLCHLIASKMRQVSESLGKQKKISKEQSFLTIYVVENELMKDAFQCKQTFLLSCLLYAFIKFKYLKINFTTASKSSPFSKKHPNSLRVCISQKSNIELSSLFYKRIAEMIEQHKAEYRQFSCHFQQININMIAQSMQQIMEEQKLKQITKLRKNIYQFVRQFYQKLLNVLPSRTYMLRQSLKCFQENLTTTRLSNKGLCQHEEEFDLTKILQKMGQFHTLQINIQNSNIKLLSKLYHQNQQNQDIELSQQSDNEQQKHLGFFGKFKGTQQQYLQKLIIISPMLANLSQIQQFTSKLPNLSQLIVFSSSQFQIVLPDANEFIQSLISNNRLIQKVQLHKIRIEKIQNQILLRLYQECPFLYDLNLNIKFKFLLGEKPAILSFQDKQKDQQDKANQTILRAMRLRYITFKNSQNMIKLLKNDGYSFTSALQIVDCIKPLCF